jgi:hypothetical protein
VHKSIQFGLEGGPDSACEPRDVVVVAYKTIRAHPEGGVEIVRFIHLFELTSFRPERALHRDTGFGLRLCV